MAQERILIVDDEKLIRWSVRSRLEEDGYEVVEAGDGAEAYRELHNGDFDLALLDYRLPDTTGLEILERVHEQSPEIAMILMTAYGTVDGAVQAIKLGAFDYLTKPMNLDELVVVIQRALETTRLRREVRRLRREQRRAHGNTRLIGTSPAMSRLLKLVGKVCVSEAATVLIEGESGTGKDVVAKAIHYGSQRSERPFVNITCSALTETLLESELFGHERGAFTDAKVQKKGLLEVADGGTAFLDEIGEMGMAMQAKLLRFLEEKTFKRVGGTRDIRVDVRVVAATNRVLDQAVQEGEFRADLFYRLKVIPLLLPPLRERREDIPLLTQHFLDAFNRKMHKNMGQVDSDAMDCMLAYDWPGNIRELRNMVERIMILENKESIELVDLPREISGHRDVPESNAASIGPASMTLEELERAAISQALDSCAGNQVQAARRLGVSRDTLRYRMKKFQLA